jgi:hypothetical protein
MPFARMRGHRPARHLASDAALEERTGFAGCPRKRELPRRLPMFAWATLAWEAREYVLSLIPEGAEVHMGMLTTLDLIGLTKEIEESKR